MTTSKPELLRKIATAMEQDPDGWWTQFEWKNEVSAQWESARSEWEMLRVALVRDLRPRPRTIRIDVEVPEPMREMPEVGQRYWLMAPQKESGYRSFTWLGDDFDREAFKQGIWPTEAEVKQTADAIFGALGRQS